MLTKEHTTQNGKGLTVVQRAAEKIEYSAVGAKITGPLTFEEWSEAVATWQRIDQSVQWVLGDLILYGEKQWGDTYTQAIDETGRGYQALANYVWVADKYEFSTRVENLNWTHHREAAAQDDRMEWLARAVAEGWSASELRRQIKKGGHRAIGSGENEWYTPGKYIEMAREVMGAIDLDPASCKAANKIVKATVFYSEQDNGLLHDWRGRVWLNPPYGREYMAWFTEKLKASYEEGAVTQAIMLCHNTTDTGWFHDLMSCCSAVCFTEGRIKFYRGEQVAAPPNGQMFLYFGAKREDFKRVFSDIGLIMEHA